MKTDLPDARIVEANVAAALAEDIGDGDITAALIPPDTTVCARIIAKESAVLCGIPWAEAVFKQLSPHVEIDWQLVEGASFNSNDLICSIQGPARPIMTAERSALNFLQTLSATATQTRELVAILGSGKTRLLDTRKTLPGLRMAQKYAVRIGGGSNHRMGLFDAYLIKENHIAACGSIEAAVSKARSNKPEAKIEVEVRDLAELDRALLAGADVVMLDNFKLEEIRAAVVQCAGRCLLEVSGGVDRGILASIAATGVDYVSVGAITKHCRAIDFSLLIQ